MKTLYVSDLDGTLLRSNATLSEFTIKTVNSLIEKGLMFTYATARSYETSRKVTKGLRMSIPLITYNGTFIVDRDGSILVSNYLKRDVYTLLDELIHHDIYPIVYAFIDGVERFAYVASKTTRGMELFLDTRKGDPRETPVFDRNELYNGNIFNVLCIDERQKLEVFYKKYKNLYHCVFEKDYYSNEQWLEFLPVTACKSAAIQELKSILQCDRIVVFGDGKNDIDMFHSADEAYAVGNAVYELKEIATSIIEENDDDGVAKWLSNNYNV